MKIVALPNICHMELSGAFGQASNSCLIKYRFKFPTSWKSALLSALFLNSDSSQFKAEIFNLLK